MSIYIPENLFLKNKYTKWYISIISSRLSRIREENIYYEKHHIIPKSLGGSNRQSNLVDLTAKEHFIVHLLLTEMCIVDQHQRKMRYALQLMMNNPSSNSNWNSGKYELARLKNLKALKGRKFTENHKKKLSESNKGVKRSNETKEKLSIAGSKRIGNLNPFFGKKHSKDTKEKIRNSKKGSKKWITNGSESRLVDINEDLEEGWRKGRKCPR